MDRFSGYFSGNRNLKKRIALSFWLTTLIIVLIASIQSAQLASARYQASQQFGGWSAFLFDPPEHSVREILENPLLVPAGRQNKTAEIGLRGDRGAYVSRGKIGTADHAFFEQANLKLKSGCWPVFKNEIVLEERTLKDLGLKAAPGSRISLILQEKDGKISEKEFVLTGILPDYSVRWSGGSDLLNGFIPMLDEAGIWSTAWFINAKSGYEDVFRTLSFKDIDVVFNENRKVSEDPFSDDNLVFTILVFLSVGINGLLCIQVLLNWIYQKRQELKLIEIIGIRRRRLTADLCFLYIRAGAIPTAAGFLGLILLRFPFFYLLWLLAFILLNDAAGLLACRIWLSVLRSRRQAEKRVGKGNSEIITVNTASRRLFKRFHQSAWIQSCTILLLFFSLFFCVLDVGQKADQLDWMNRGADFIVKAGTTPFLRYRESSTSQENTVLFISEPILEKAIDELNQVESLQIERSYFMSQYEQAEWVGMEASPLFEQGKLKPGLMDVFRISDSEYGFYPRIVRISDPAFVSVVQNLVTAGEVNWENWKSGKEVLAYLPKVSGSSDFIAADWKGSTDESLRPGTVLNLTDQNGLRSEYLVSGLMTEQTTEKSVFSPYTFYLYGNEPSTLHLKLTRPEDRQEAEEILDDLAERFGLTVHNGPLAGREEEHLKTVVIFEGFFMLVMILSALIVLNVIREHNFRRLEHYRKRMSRLGLPAAVLEKITDRVIFSNLVTVVLPAAFVALVYIICVLVGQSAWFPARKIGMILIVFFAGTGFLILYTQRKGSGLKKGQNQKA